jgi:hypothetical protein
MVAAIEGEAGVGYGLVVETEALSITNLKEAAGAAGYGATR